MPIRRITAWIDFDPPVEREEAIQALGEAVLDDGAELSFDETPTATRAKGKNEPETESDLLTLIADIEHGIEQAREAGPASDSGWTLEVVDLRAKVKTLYRVLQDEAFPIGADSRLALRGKLDVAAKTMLREFFGLSDEQAQSIIQGR